ncbi:peptidylprolyl isomerase [Ideonella sp.]|uniref:peptidylprolyl isomerase n=1 Tax=Ideonella sp. TaxID=1929293 RepID=UPI002B47BF87|nr:peptidylprolyl isomerase [Ideonella sp.]HJV72190.1 peptidylprolyl isomerase [Ideonella sp.]
MIDTTRLRAAALALAATALACAAASAQPAAQAAAAAARTPARQADYIVAIVNNELVTQVELDQRIARARLDALRTGARLPPDAELRKQVLDALIEERVVVTYARDSGLKVDEPELDRAVANVAAANKLTLDKLQDRLKAEGIDYARFRANLRDQMLAERVREREVISRIRVTDAEIDNAVAARQGQMAASSEMNIAQILVTVPENASPEVVAERREKALAALARVRGGEPFEVVAKAVSEDANKDKGGEIGAKPADRLPDLFVNAVKPLAVGAVTAEPVRSGAGFHILKLLSRSDVSTASVTQTRARHILLRPSTALPVDAAQKRLAEFRDQILAGSRRFEDVARQYSEDGSAAGGGDLGWTAPGSLVPEFEEAMNKLPPGGISQPVVSRFGVHLIQVVERRQVAVDPKELREQARNVLREQKFGPAYTDWAAELKARAYIEMREPPQ